MIAKAHVAKKYVIEYGANEFFADEFDKLLSQLQEIHEDIICWCDENHDNYELNRDLVKNISKREDISDDLRKQTKILLDESDPNLDYIKVEIW